MQKNFEVAELMGPDLDRAVAISLGYVEFNGPWWQHTETKTLINIETFSPSTRPDQGHAIIEESWIGLERPTRAAPMWGALSDPHGPTLADLTGKVVAMTGPTALIAAMRCKVASVFGPKITMRTLKVRKTAAATEAHE